MSRGSRGAQSRRWRRKLQAVAVADGEDWMKACGFPWGAREGECADGAISKVAGRKGGGRGRGEGEGRGRRSPSSSAPIAMTTTGAGYRLGLGSDVRLGTK